VRAGKSAVPAYNTTFGTAATSEWLHPTDVLQGRLVKIGRRLRAVNLLRSESRCDALRSRHIDDRVRHDG